jgi:hypothetical protein
MMATAPLRINDVKNAETELPELVGEDEDDEELEDILPRRKFSESGCFILTAFRPLTYLKGNEIV